MAVAADFHRDSLIPSSGPSGGLFGSPLKRGNLRLFFYSGIIPSLA